MGLNIHSFYLGLVALWKTLPECQNSIPLLKMGSLMDTEDTAAANIRSYYTIRMPAEEFLQVTTRFHPKETSLSLENS